jgi:hypothetical protein
MLHHAAAAFFRPGCSANLPQRPRMNILQVSDSFGIRDTASHGEINRPRAYVSDIMSFFTFQQNTYISFYRINDLNAID